MPAGSTSKWNEHALITALYQDFSRDVVTQLACRNIRVYPDAPTGLAIH